MSNKKTIEDAFNNWIENTSEFWSVKNGFMAGSDWKAKKMYSEIHLILENVLYWDTCPDDFKEDIKKWLNDYKQDNEQ
jgi:hypothetical protein